jgi:hypothetical protein
MNRKINEDLVQESRRYWKQNIKTSFLTFLACKMVVQKIEIPFYMGKYQYNQFINKFLVDNGKIINPCTNRYPKKPDSYYSSLGSYIRFEHFLWYDENLSRGNYKLPHNYIEDVSEMFKPKQLSLEYVSIWLFRNELWANEENIDNVIDMFISTFTLSDKELKTLFIRQNNLNINFDNFCYKKIEIENGTMQLILPVAADFDEIKIPGRKLSLEYRIIRDTYISYSVKQLHDYKCQICGQRILLANKKKYAEAHHIKPLGKMHQGPDTIENILCLCPNCHVLLDFGAIKLNVANIRTNPRHKISSDAITYHNEHIYKNNEHSS